MGNGCSSKVSVDILVLFIGMSGLLFWISSSLYHPIGIDPLVIDLCMFKACFCHLRKLLWIPMLSGDTWFHLRPPIPPTSDLTPFLTSLLTTDSLPNPFIIQLQGLHPLQLWCYPLFTLPLFLHSYSPSSLPPSTDNLWLIWLVCNSDVYLISIISPLMDLHAHHTTSINYSHSTFILIIH